MRKWLLNNMAVVMILVGVNAALRAENTFSYFVILPDNAAFLDYSDRVELAGGKVRLSVPPQILTIESAKPLDLNGIGIVKRIYTGPISLADLEVYGPLATAAGIEWNRGRVRQATQMGTRAASTMRTMAAEQSVPAPMGLAVSLLGDAVHASWNARPGASHYVLQLSPNANFSGTPLETNVNETSVDLPRLESVQPVEAYVRVRSMDGDLAGAWSSAQKISLSAFTNLRSIEAPRPTSPLDASESDGFTVTLEWINDPALMSRVQVSSSENFAKTIVDRIVGSGQVSPPPSVLRLGETYFWRVQNWSAAGSNWSDVRRFKVAEPNQGDHDAMINPEAPR